MKLRFQILPISDLNTLYMWSIQQFVLNMHHNLIENTAEKVKVLISLFMFPQTELLLTVFPRLQQHVIDNNFKEDKGN